MFNYSIFNTEKIKIPNDIWIKLGAKRPYNADYKPFQTCLSPKNFLIQAIKGSCVPLLHVTKEMEQFNKEKWEAMQKKKKVRDEEFDIQAAVKRQIPLLVESTKRFYITSVIRKCYDLVALLKFSAKLSDRLCKDVGKSAVRKIRKYGRVTAASKMLRTMCYGNSLNYISSFTYDMLYCLYEYVILRKYPLRITSGASWVVRKGMFYCILLSSSSAGYCLGTLIGDSNQVVSSLLSMFAEVIAADWAAKMLNL